MVQCAGAGGNDCGNPYYDPNYPNNAQFLAAVRASGILGDHHGLISGAQNGVCPELAAGKPYQEIAGDLERYARYSRGQAHSYITQAVARDCPDNAGMLP